MIQRSRVFLCAFTAAGAFLRIPLPYVPVTLQLTGVCLAGVWLGPRLGALSQVVYLLAGLVGLPIFAQGGGPHYLLHPSFGYLVGFPAAAAIVGAVGHGSYSPLRAGLAAAAGLLAVYAPGITGLYCHARWVQAAEVPLSAVVRVGLVPVPKDLLITVPAVVAALRARSTTHHARTHPAPRPGSGWRPGQGLAASGRGPSAVWVQKMLRYFIRP